MEKVETPVELLDKFDSEIINEYFQQADSVAKLPAAMKEHAIIYRTLGQMEKMIYRLAKEYESIDDEDFKREEFADTVNDIVDTVKDELMQYYDVELRALLEESFPEGI